MEGRGFRADACNGSAGGRALAHATGNRNHVWSHFLHSVSSLCMKGHSIVKRSHVPGHMVDESMEEEEEERGLGAAGRGQVEEEVSAPWMRDPEWLYLPHLQQDRQEELKTRKTASGRTDKQHLLRASGAIIWCLRCGCFAALRHGKGLKGQCQPGKNSSARVRIARLQAGRHPLTGAHL